MARPGSGRSRIALALALVALFIGSGLALLFGSARPTHTQIRVESLWSDRVDAPSNEVVYVVKLNASNYGSEPWQFDPSSLVLVSNASRAYSFLRAYNATATMPQSSISSGNYVVGKVPFLLPANEAPSKLQYEGQSPGSSPEITPIPQVSSVAYRFNLNARITANNIPVAAGGWTPSECPTTTVNGTGPWICSIILNGLVQNATIDTSCPYRNTDDGCSYTVVYFSGQTVEVNLWFEYLKKPTDPQAVALQSVAAGSGFELVNVTGSLPVRLTGTALNNPLGQGGVDVFLKVLPGAHDGDIYVSVWLSALGS